jgi:hypothetical protein
VALAACVTSVAHQLARFALRWRGRAGNLPLSLQLYAALHTQSSSAASSPAR